MATQFFQSNTVVGRIRRTMLLTILLSVSALLHAQPRLTVVVMVDGMTQENLTAMRPYWSSGGLRLMSEEAFQTTIAFPHHVYGGTETTATLMTGTTPSHHGIMGDWTFNRAYRTTHYVLQDDQVAGIGTNLQLSPRAISTTTITDEWRIQQGVKAKIYAVGLHPQTTILMAGHAANACCWLDPNTYKWVTTSFYAEGLPTAADAMNMSDRITILSERTWTPRLDISMYTSPTKDEKRRLFNYLPKKHLLQTPAANTLGARSETVSNNANAPVRTFLLSFICNLLFTRSFSQVLYGRHILPYGQCKAGSDFETADCRGDFLI